MTSAPRSLNALPGASGTDHPTLRPVIRVASGNFLEMYDFQVFGYYAAPIARTFFPAGNEFASLMLSLGTFGAGFLMRPLGAVLLGGYMDRRGRRAGLLLTLGLMAIGTISIACTPSFAAIGLMAPLAVVAGRLVQGLSAGAEAPGVSVYLSEIATPGRKGFYTSWQSASQSVAVVFAAVLGLALTRRLRPDEMMQWGWRIPLLVGCAIIPLLFLLRRSLEDTPAFLERGTRPSPRDVLRTVARSWRLVLLGTLLMVVSTACFYMITVYTPTFGGTILHLAARDNLTVTLCVGASNVFWLPIMGAMSDRVGRRPQLAAVNVLVLLTGYPAFAWLVQAPSFGRLMGVELWFSLLFASYNGAMLAFLTEIMPPDVRAAGFSLVHSCATAIFGGFTPTIATYLIHTSGNRAMPGAWLAFTAACGLVATALLRSPDVARLSAVRALRR